MKIEAEHLERMAKAGFDRNMELCWPDLVDAYGMTSVSLSGVEHSWERQSKGMRDNWIEQVKAILTELELP